MKKPLKPARVPSLEITNLWHRFANHVTFYLITVTEVLTKILMRQPRVKHCKPYQVVPQHLNQNLVET